MCQHTTREPAEGQLPDPLELDHPFANLDHYQRELLLEHQPVGFTELIMVQEMAWRGSQMAHLQAMHRALERQAAHALADVARPLAGASSRTGDAALAAMAAGGRLDEISRRDLGNSRAFYRALQELLHLKAERWELAHRDLGQPDSRFAHEEACCAHLVRRYQQGLVACHRCRQPGKGCWLVTHRCWECGHCGAQTGIRTGTVMERSALPLPQWFHAVRCVLLKPTITSGELGKFLGIGRLPTVRSLAKKTRAALASEYASGRLAGLDLVYLPRPDPSARFGGKFFGSPSRLRSTMTAAENPEIDREVRWSHPSP